MSDEWTTYRLGDVCSKIGSGATPRGGSSVYLEDGEVTLVRSQNVYNHGFERQGLVFLTEEHADELSNVEVLQDDVLLNITGDSVARSCRIDPGVLPARVNQHVAIIRADPSLLSPLFLRYYLVSPAMQAHMLSLAGAGATRNALTKGMIEEFMIRAPTDVFEQKVIAHILGILDEKIEIARRSNETLEAMSQALFKDWFIDFGPVRAKVEKGEPYLSPELWSLFPDSFAEEIPRGWEPAKLSDLVKLNPAERLTKGTPAPYLDMASLPTSGMWPDRPSSREFGSGMKFRNGDTLFARITPCLENGKTAFVNCLDQNQVAWGSTEFIVLRPTSPIPPQFAYLLARDSKFRAHAIRSMTGTSGRQRVQAESLASFDIAKAPEPVYVAFGELTGAWFTSIKKNALEAETLGALRDTLLPQLISGELRVRDAEHLIEASPA